MKSRKKTLGAVVFFILLAVCGLLRNKYYEVSTEDIFKRGIHTTEILTEELFLNYNAASQNKSRSAPFYESVMDGSKLYMNCNKCAFVTSSGFLKNSELGEEIDSYDCTIRTNDSPTTEYQSDVGIKTSVRILGFPGKYLYGKRMGNGEIHKNERTGTVLLGWAPPRLTGKNKSFTEQLLRWQNLYPDMKVYQFINISWAYAEYDKLLNKQTKTDPDETWLSTGFFGMLFARQYCGQIYVYGMTDENYCQRIQNDKYKNKDKPYHYYESGAAHNVNECEYSKSQRQAKEGHRYHIEKMLIWQWATEYKNIFFKLP